MKDFDYQIGEPDWFEKMRVTHAASHDGVDITRYDVWTTDVPPQQIGVDVPKDTPPESVRLLLQRHLVQAGIPTDSLRAIPACVRLDG